MQVSTPRDLRSERGSILVLTTLLLPALVAVGAVAAGVTTLWASHSDAQRAVDLAALAGAANTPTASIDSDSVGLPFEIEGLAVTVDVNAEAGAGADVDGPVDASVRSAFALDSSTAIEVDGVSLLDPVWRNRPCQVFGWQLFEAGRSAVLNASKRSQPTCTAHWQYESKTLAALAACVRNELDVPDCQARLENRLARTLPVLKSTDPLVTGAMATLATEAAKLTDPTTELLDATWQQTIDSACLVPLPIVGPCPLTFAQLLLDKTEEQLAEAGRSPTGGLLPHIDPRHLAPAVLTPRLKVQLHGGDIRPMLSPYTFDLDASATARRTIKRAIVLPSLGLADPDGEDRLPDPDDVVRASTVVDATELLLDMVDAVDHMVSKGIADAILQAACAGEQTGGYVSEHCPEMSSVVATKDLRDIFMQDLRDATEPQPDGPSLSLQESLDELAASGDPAWAVAPLTTLSFEQLLANAGAKQTEIQSLKLLNPALAPLFNGLVAIPALDVVPVTVRKITSADGITPQYVLEVINDAGATSGLFQARLVK